MGRLTVGHCDFNMEIERGKLWNYGMKRRGAACGCLSAAPSGSWFYLDTLKTGRVQNILQKLMTIMDLAADAKPDKKKILYGKSR